MDKRALLRLRMACERAKRTLSSSTDAAIRVDALVDGVDFRSTITRAQFEEMCDDLFHTAMAPVARVLKNTERLGDPVQDVVLIGGSTRIPKIQQLLSAMFHADLLRQPRNEDEAAVRGAAVRAAILSRQSSELLYDVLLLDATPQALGVATADGEMMTVLARNTTVPTKKTQLFTTDFDNQHEVVISVVEGDENRVLGEVLLNDLPRLPRGELKIGVTFDFDAEGLLMVSAVESTTGKKTEVTITNGSGRFSPAAMARAARETETYKKRKELTKYAHECRQWLHETAVSVELRADYDGLASTVARVFAWIDANPAAEQEAYVARYTELKTLQDLVTQKLSGQGAPRDDTPRTGRAHVRPAPRNSRAAKKAKAA